MKKKITSSSNDITKDYLKDELNNLELRIDIKFDKLQQAMDDKGKEYRDDVLNKLDGVMGEFETIREDNLIGTHQISELHEQTENHEKRITNLEKVQSPAE